MLKSKKVLLWTIAISATTIIVPFTVVACSSNQNNGSNSQTGNSISSSIFSFIPNNLERTATITGFHSIKNINVSTPINIPLTITSNGIQYIVRSIASSAFKTINLAIVNIPYTSNGVPITWTRTGNDASFSSNTVVNQIIRPATNSTAAIIQTFNWDIVKNEFIIISSQDILYSFNNVANEATVIGVNNVDQNIINIPSTVELNGTTYSVVKIQANAFLGNSITNLSIGNNVSIIEHSAFAFNQINTINFEANSKLTSIEPNAFQGNDISNLALPSSLVSISESAFSQNQISKLNLNDLTNLTSIGVNAFSQNLLTTISIPSSLITISTGAFQSNTIASILFDQTNSKLETIGNNAFFNNVLVKIDIPNSVKSIGNNAFSLNSSLVNVIISNSNTNWIKTSPNVSFNTSATINQNNLVYKWNGSNAFTA